MFLLQGHQRGGVRRRGGREPLIRARAAAAALGSRRAHGLRIAGVQQCGAAHAQYVLLAFQIDLTVTQPGKKKGWCSSGWWCALEVVPMFHVQNVSPAIADAAALRKSGALPLLSQPQAQARRRQHSSVAGHLYHRRKRNVLASLHDDSCVFQLSAPCLRTSASS